MNPLMMQFIFSCGSCTICTVVVVGRYTHADVHAVSNTAELCKHSLLGGVTVAQLRRYEKNKCKQKDPPRKVRQVFYATRYLHTSPCVHSILVQSFT
jgi:hypothetical protein